MQSERVFYTDPYKRELTASVLAIERDALILDRTICYPEGGGQGGDRGTINGVQLLDTQLSKDGRILHIVEDSSAFTAGNEVTIILDWARRYHFMQMHTAQHMASGILYDGFGIGTRSVHLGEEIMTIETDAAHIDDATIAAVEETVNARIAENRPTASKTYARDEALALGLRRSIKVESSTVRLVTIDGVDTIACGGLHVKQSSEIGLFYYVGQERMRSHVRLIFAVGANAWRRVRAHRAAIDALGTLFSAPLSDLVASAEQAVATAASEKSELTHLQTRYAVARLKEEVRHATDKGHSAFHWEVEEGISLASIAQASNDFDELFLCATSQAGKDFLWLIIAKGEKAASFDFAQFRSTLFGDFAAKGGGRPPVYQGRGSGSGKEFALRVLEALG